MTADLPPEVAADDELSRLGEGRSISHGITDRYERMLRDLGVLS